MYISLNKRSAVLDPIIGTLNSSALPSQTFNTATPFTQIPNGKRQSGGRSSVEKLQTFSKTLEDEEKKTRGKKVKRLEI